jgi:hypothetical protein
MRVDGLLLWEFGGRPLDYWIDFLCHMRPVLTEFFR